MSRLLTIWVTDVCVLLKYTSTDYEITSEWGADFPHYLVGKLLTKMSKPDEAIKNLTESRMLGLKVGLSHYKHDIKLAPLVGIPEFDALHDPIWPEVKN